MLVYVDPYHTTRKASYVYTRLYVSLVSASRPVIHWVRATIRRLLGLLGDVHIRRKLGRRHVWVLRYAKRAKAEPFISGVK